MGEAIIACFSMLSTEAEGTGKTFPHYLPWQRKPELLLVCGSKEGKWSPRRGPACSQPGTQPWDPSLGTWRCCGLYHLKTQRNGWVDPSILGLCEMKWTCLWHLENPKWFLHFLKLPLRLQCFWAFITNMSPSLSPFLLLSSLSLLLLSLPLSFSPLPSCSPLSSSSLPSLPPLTLSLLPSSLSFPPPLSLSSPYLPTLFLTFQDKNVSYMKTICFVDTKTEGCLGCGTQ